MRILYVEDNPLDADLTCRELARRAPHYQVDVVPTVREGRDHLIGDTSYDLILLDLRLPDGSGLDLLSEIREQVRPLAAVVLTGSGDEEAALAALKAGADDYLVKRGDYLVRLPLALETALHQFRAEAARKARLLRVLYAEHNAADIDLTRRHLARHAPHIHLEVVYTAEEILQRLPLTPQEPSPYEVVLLDYRLPCSSALELLKDLRQDRGLDLPIVLVTGQGDEDIAIQAWRLGATDYLVKNTGYLFKLPVIVENAFHRVQLGREQIALRESEARYRQIIETAQEGIWTIDAENNTTFVNQKMAEMLGYTVDEMAGRSLFSFISTENEALAAIHVGRRQQGIAERHEFQFVRKDGSHLWALLSTNPLYDDEGAYTGALAMVVDISALKETQKAEHEQRRLSEALADTASALISALDLDAVMNTILENVAHVVPHDAANIMLIEGDQARPVYWLGYWPEQTQYLQKFYISVTDNPNLHVMVETGSPFLASHTDQYADWIHHPLTEWVKSYVAAPIRSHGNVIGFLNLDSGTPGFFNEYHAQCLQTFADQASIAIEQAQLYEEKRRHADELEQRVEERTAELNETKNRIEAILNSSNDIIILCWLNGKIDQVNPIFNETFHCEPDQVYNQPLTALVAPQDVLSMEQAFAEVVETGQPKRLEVTIHCLQRITFDADMVLSPIVEHDNRLSGVVCSLRDITERKQMEAQLRRMLAHEMELGELKSRYVSMAAHDLRSPLAVIQSMISLLHQYNDRLSEEQKQAKYDRVKISIKVMVDMLDDILTIGQVESGKLTFNPAPLDMVAFCQSISTEIGQAASAASPIVFSSQGECGHAWVDAKLLRHVLGNLLSNALKYSLEDRPVTFTVRCEPDQITIRVQDQGIGIPEDDQQRLFEAFHRASNARYIPGTGLGLAIVKQSVGLHGGTITCESKEGVGTTFTVILPQALPGDAQERNPGQ